MFIRILSNARKHILRSSWIGFASVFVMALAFLVASIFAGLAFIANLNIQNIESKSNVLVFFNVGMDIEVVNRLEEKWGTLEDVKEITYLTEEQAYSTYAEYTSRILPEIYKVLNEFEEKKLPSSLEIKLSKLDNIKELQSAIQADIDSELRSLVILKLDEQSNLVDKNESEVAVIEDGSEAEQTIPEANESVASETDQITVVDLYASDVRYKYAEEPGDVPIALIVDAENLSKQKDVFFQLRIAGIGTMGLLMIFVVIFVFMTTEFRLFNQKEEIGVMQLVGGSLLFIRSPYVLEGGFYGFAGAVISMLFIGGLYFALFIANQSSSFAQYIYAQFGQLPWPQFTPAGWLAMFAGLALSGFLLGAISSYMSIRRYIR